MRINTNISAMNTHRQYGINNAALSKSTEKLSSGYRINSAADDAAGLAISEKMRAQIRGLNQASANCQDAVSLVQTTEGYLQTAQNILQRMEELATQVANGTYTDNDRELADIEYQQLVDELNDIFTDSTFNDLALFASTTTTLGAVATGAEDSMDAINWTSFLSQLGIDESCDNISISTAVTQAVDGTGGTAATDASITYTITWDDEDGTSFTATFTVEADAEDTAVTAATSGTAYTEFSGGKVDYTVTSGGTQVATGEVNVKAFDVENAVNSGAVAVTIEGGQDTTYTMQTGWKTAQTTEITIGAISIASLGVDALKLDTQEDANYAIDMINDAIDTISRARAELGAYQNRFEYKIENLDISAENLSAAESRIRDVDMAAEMTEYTKQSILAQAATAMLAQANSQPQLVLQLLG